MLTDVSQVAKPQWRAYLVSLTLGLVLFFLMALDQGQLLSLIQGQVAYSQNLIHESVHDSRHVNGMPCH